MNLLKITSETSILDGITLLEPIDIAILDKLINSTLLKTTFRNPFAEVQYASERSQLDEYKKLIVGGFARVKYSRPKGMPYGRSNPAKSLGLFSIRREIRHTLAKKYFVDIDIENCHPVILLNICEKNDIDCEYLEKYVKNRNEYLAKVMETYNVKRDAAKNLFIRLLFFGTFEAWGEENKISDDAVELKFIKKFAKELAEIGKVIVENNPDLVKLIKKRKSEHTHMSNNLHASVSSYFLQEHERRILETLFDYCRNHDIIEDDVCVLCADGLMIKKGNYDDTLLTTFSKIIKKKYGIELKFTTKEMDEDFLDKLDSCVLTEEALFKVEAKEYESKLVGIDLDEGFDMNTLQDLFLKDLKLLGPKTYQTYFDNTKSFKYYNYYHAYFKEQNATFMLHQNNIVCNGDIRNTMNHLQFTDNRTVKKFTTMVDTHLNKRKYGNFIFEPNVKKRIGDKFNTFTGFHYENGTTEYDMELVTPFLNHISFMCRDDANVTNYILNWFAHIIQTPHIKTKVALVFYTKTEGVGKNIMSDIFSGVLKGYVTRFKDTSDLTKQFNGHMFGKLFVVGDEINGRAQEVCNEIKDIITREVENIEFKGKDVLTNLKDCKNYFFTTNNENVFKVSNSDRRFMFIEGPDQVRERSYYATLFDMLGDDVKLRNLYNYFKARDLSEYTPSRIVVTEYKRNLLDANMESHFKFIGNTYEDYEGEAVLAKKLYTDFLKYARENKLSRSMTEMAFCKDFKKYFGKYQILDSKRRSCYQFEILDPEVDTYKFIADLVNGKPPAASTSKPSSPSTINEDDSSQRKRDKTNQIELSRELAKEIKCDMKSLFNKRLLC